MKKFGSSYKPSDGPNGVGHTGIGGNGKVFYYNLWHGKFQKIP